MCTFFLFISLLSGNMWTSLKAEIDLGYQKPPKDIVDLIDAPATPSISLSPKMDKMLFLERLIYASLEEVAQPELRIGGIRINPTNNGPSRSRYFTNLKLKPFDGDLIQVEGLPKIPRIENITWSPDGSRIAFTHSKDTGIELWIVEVVEGRAKKQNIGYLNGAMRGPLVKWLSNSNQLVVKVIPANRLPLPTEQAIPQGPIIQENNGASAALRTYQDLLSNQYDEALFDYYTTADLVLFDIESNQSVKIINDAVITSFDPSPDGRLLLVTQLEKPYSYVVPYYRFPQKVAVFNTEGEMVKTLASIPISEDIPIGFGAVRKGPRSFSWRADVPSTIYWVEALDGGDPKKKVPFRDRLYCLECPFDQTPTPVMDFALRYNGIAWGNNEVAIAYENWWATRQEIVSYWNPNNPGDSKTELFNRSTEDRYGDPGDFKRTLNASGRSVLQSNGKGQLFLVGTGASPEGNRPFIDTYDLKKRKSKRVWQSSGTYYEYPITILDSKKGVFLSRKESKEMPPNYHLNNYKTKSANRITFFENPYQALDGIKKELVKYQRADGVNLTGTLYLPKGYDAKRDGALPVLMWAYPREFKSAKAAGQVSGSPHQFVRLFYGSPIFWVTRGYAVFDNFAMPIIGEGINEPNETFVEQLRMGAEAAIDYLVDRGIGDRNRIGVGGHSYGAFMTANLLAHTDLFAAGIARSGAYNRTLTPFGFQREERTFWEAPEVYFKMSPFMFADKIKEPILLIHGEADNNSGTFPLQSKRFYAALKGHGTTARLVMLPHESHGYRAKESIFHMLWEMDQWLEKYVKHKKPVASKV